MVLETSVHDALYGFSQVAEKIDGAVAGLAVPVLPFLEDGDDYGFFPACSKCPCVPGLVVYVQQFLFSHTYKMTDNCIGNAILPGGFLVFLLSDAAVQLMDGELRCHAGVWRLFL